MAIRYATSSGNWSDPAIWDGGVSIPTTGDEVYSNNFRVDIDVAIIDSMYLTNGSNVSPAINSGGGFNLNTSCDISSDIRWHNATNVIANHLIHIIGTSSINVFFTGNFIWAASGTAIATIANVIRIENANAYIEWNGGEISRPPLAQNVAVYKFRLFEGELHINADVKHFGTLASSNPIHIGGLNVVSPPKLNITGTLTQEATSASGTGGALLSIQPCGVDGMEVNLVGDTIQTSSIYAFSVFGAHIHTITINQIGNYIINHSTVNNFLHSTVTVPNLTINWTGYVIRNLFGTLTIVGSGTRNITTNLNHIVSSANDIMQLTISTNITINFYGNMEGGNVANARAFSLIAGPIDPIINIYGNIIAGDSTTTTVLRYDFHPCGFYSTNITVQINVNGNVIGGASSDCVAMVVRGAISCVIEKAITGLAPFYATPYIGSIRFKADSPEFRVAIADGSSRVLVDPTLEDYPIENNVRGGVAYAFNNLQGALIIPGPEDVRKGVAVDDTVGTGIITGEDFFELIKTSADPIAERLRNVATVQTVGDQFNSFNP